MALLLLPFLLGASVASFLNLVADRLPQGRSIVQPPSSCPHCGRRLSPLELVPVLSYLALRGRCYQCRAPIPLRSLVLELGLGILGAYLWWRHGPSLAALVLFGYVSFLLLLAIIDLDHGIIPNALVYPGLLVTLLLSPWWNYLGLPRSFVGSSGPGYVLLGSLAGALVAGGLFVAMILLYPGGMGWGDPKMAAVIGLATGMPGVVVALLIALVGGGVVALVLIALRRKSRKDTMPFGPFLALGGALALLWGSGLWQWYVAILG